MAQKYYPTTEELIAMFPPSCKERSSKCLVYTLATFVTLFAVFLLFASVVLRVRDVKVELRTARAMHISYRTSSKASFNVTMIAHVTILNPNFGPFYYERNALSVLYGLTSVGSGEMGGARVEAKETKEIKVMVNMRSNMLLLSGYNLTNDIRSGILNLRSYAKLSGTVHLLKIIKKRETVVMACTMILDLNSHLVHHFEC